MSKLIPQELVEKIQAQTDIVKLVSEYVKLQPSGRSMKGLCPFHSERTPSFTVDPEKQLFHCFGCGEGGNVFAFIMKAEQLNFREAVAWAGARCGITVELEENKEDRARQELFGIMEAAMDYYATLLRQDSGEAARAYLKRRGISPQSALEFKLGLAPSGWEELATYLSARGISLQLAESLGLVKTGKRGGYYDLFHKRLIFPICNAQGKTIGFGGRLMEQGEPKYLNSPETVLFQKGKQLYALHLAKKAIRQAGCAVVTEGYLDVLAAHQAGFANTVASLGTALTEDQAKVLGRYTKKVILAYDADAAGQKATLRGMELFRQAGFEVFVASLPEGEDPDSLIRKHGPESFGKCLAEAKPLLDYQLAIVLSGNLETPAGRAEAGKRVVGFLGRIENSIEREAYLRQAAARLGLSPESLMREVSGQVRPPARQKNARKQARLTAVPAYLRAEKQLLCLMSQKREIIEEIMHKIGGDSAFSPANREIFASLTQSAAAGERLTVKVKPDPAITIDDCIAVILEHNAEKELSLLEEEFKRKLDGTIQLSKLMSATIKYKAFQERLARRLNRKEG